MGQSREMLGLFCFEDVFDFRDRFIQHAHIIASAGLCVGLHAFVGQMASNKGSASKFLRVAVPNIRMRVRQGRAMEGHWEFIHKMTLRKSFTPPKGGNCIQHASILP